MALINSLEKAEDYPDFGKKHLIEANLKPGDLAIGITETSHPAFSKSASYLPRLFLVCPLFGTVECLCEGMVGSGRGWVGPRIPFFGARAAEALSSGRHMQE